MQLRPATSGDLPVLAELWLRSRRAAHPAMPPPAHSEAEVREWVRGWDLTATDVWVAEVDGAAVALLRATPTWLDDLYVDPSYAGQGAGTALLELLKALRPDGFGLWVFESNHPARAFYAAHGLVEGERTDGAENEEGEPDVAMHWRPTAGGGA